MQKKFKKFGVCFLITVFLFLLMFTSSATAASDCEVSYRTICDWKYGYYGTFTLKNNSKRDLDGWKIEFDWNSKVTSISNAKIESKTENHYVLSCIKHNKVIRPGSSININIMGKSAVEKSGPENFVITDIYDKLSLEDKKWQQYYGEKSGQEFRKSYAHGIAYMWSKFPADEPHRIGYEIIEKKPVTDFINARYQNVEIPTHDGLKLRGLFFPVKKAKGTIIMLHGYGSTAIWETQKLKYLLDNGYQILSYNARYWNYYNTPEKYIELMSNEVLDVDSAVKYLKTRRDVDKKKIGIYGFSYGASKEELYAGLYKDDVRAFIFDGGSTTVPTYSDYYTWDMIGNDVFKILKQEYGDSSDIFKSLSVLPSVYTSAMSKVKKPVLFIHGLKDTIPVSEVNELYNAVQGDKEKYIFENSGHCDAMNTSDKDVYVRKVLNFLDKHFKK